MANYPTFEQGDKIVVLFSDGSDVHGTIDSIPLDCGDMWRIITQNVDGVKLLLALNPYCGDLIGVVKNLEANDG